MAYNVEMFPSSSRTNIQVSTRTEQELLQALHANADGAMVVTSTVRAARALQHHYDQWQHSSGNAGWKTPKILAWEPWLGTLWNAAILTGAETRVLLTEVQELELWQKVLAADDAAMRTFSTSTLAELAQHAWNQMHQYGISPALLRGDSSLDTKAFYRWAAEFEKTCRKSSLLSPSLLEAAIAQWISSSKTSLPEQLFLLGFDRVTPSQTLLINALTARGCSMQFVELQPTELVSSSRAIVYARTLEEEIASAAHWARNTLLENPTQRIGIIVPALEELRGQIDATFRRILAPSSMDIRAQHVLLPYEFSLGSPMHRLQPIRTALTLLRWLFEAIPPEDISWLLVHGGFSGEPHEQRDARARLDSRFRERDFQLGGPTLLAAFRQWLSQSGSREQFAALLRTIERFSLSAQRHGMEKSRFFGEWREIIEDLLATIEWHLLTTATSVDYQLLRRWNTLLNNLSSLNSVAGPVKFSVVLAKLEHLAAHTLFTLETRNAPVQILGISESAGLVFDSIWWVNARASVWPPRGKAQPFLPWNLQREAHMPYADPVEDSAFALRTTKRILDSGRNVVISFALQESDAANISTHVPDREILLSPPVREALPNTTMVSAGKFLPAQPKPQRNQSDVALENSLEEISEEPAVPFPGTQVRGGVRFLELHAACPFRAFAELRLGTRPLAGTEAGLSPGDQGNIIHQVLEQFWKEIQSRKNLLDHTTDQHRDILRQHIRHALAEFFQHANEPWQQTLLNIEAERLEQRLLAWLEQEKQRPEFTVIGTEQALENPHLGGLQFQCRVDRIDQVEQGIVLLDYKTGKVDRNACEGNRPDQPQLPAYAVLRHQDPTTENSLAGVAFAGLYPKKIGFTIVDSLPSVFSVSPKPLKEAGAESFSKSKHKLNPAALTPEEMQSQLEAWSASLTRLAEEFQAGAAIVDPKKPGETCKYCAQALLCRIREATGDFEGSDEDEEEESASLTESFEL